MGFDARAAQAVGLAVVACAVIWLGVRLVWRRIEKSPVILGFAMQDLLSNVIAGFSIHRSLALRIQGFFAHG